MAGAMNAAMASTWCLGECNENGDALRMTPERVDMLNDSFKCTGDGGYDDVTAVYLHASEDSGMTVFALRDDGLINGFKNMTGERFALDYCGEDDWNQ